MNNRIYLTKNSWCIFEENFIKNEQNLLNYCLKEVEWKQEYIKFGSKQFKLPRLTAWFGEKTYVYSGVENKPRKFTPELTYILEDLKNYGFEFNSVLLNRYRDGKDSIGFHADDEPELESTIASISLGAKRRFILRNNKTNDIFEYGLGNGNLLIMGGDCQKEFKHSIPKEQNVSGERVNLTFRRIK